MCRIKIDISCEGFYREFGSMLKPPPTPPSIFMIHALRWLFLDNFVFFSEIPNKNSSDVIRYFILRCTIIWIKIYFIETSYLSKWRWINPLDIFNHFSSESQCQQSMVKILCSVIWNNKQFMEFFPRFVHKSLLAFSR